MTAFYKIQQIVDGVSGEVLKEQILDTVHSEKVPECPLEITLFSGDIVYLLYIPVEEYDLNLAQSLESWEDEDSVSFPDPCEATE